MRKVRTKTSALFFKRFNFCWPCDYFFNLQLFFFFFYLLASHFLLQKHTYIFSFKDLTGPVCSVITETVLPIPPRTVSPATFTVSGILALMNHLGCLQTARAALGSVVALCQSCSWATFYAAWRITSQFIRSVTAHCTFQYLQYTVHLIILGCVPLVTFSLTGCPDVFSLRLLIFS